MSTSGLNCYLWKYPAVANVQVHVYFCLHNKIFYLWTFSIKLPKAGRIIFIGYPHNQAQPWHKQQRKKLKSLCIFSPFAAKTWEVLWWQKKVPNWFSEKVTPPPFAAQQFAAAHSPSTPLLFYSNRIVPVTQIRKGNFREWKRSEKATMAQRRKLIAKWGGGGGDAEIAFLFTVALLCLTITILVFCFSTFTVLFVVRF